LLLSSKKSKNVIEELVSCAFITWKIIIIVKKARAILFVRAIIFLIMKQFKINTNSFKQWRSLGKAEVLIIIEIINP
jgi:hypothetical protein